MHPKALAIFYALSIFVLGTALFVLQPSQKPEVAELQGVIKQQISIAWQQTWGDRPFLAEVGDVYDGIAEFYNQSSNATVALLAAPDSDRDIAFVLQAVYSDFADVFRDSPSSVAEAPQPILPEKFMTESPIYNIVPSTTTAAVTAVGSVSGAVAEPVNAPNSWVTIQDNFTGQLYCLAVYNGEVNKYLGACRNDYH